MATNVFPPTPGATVTAFLLICAVAGLAAWRFPVRGEDAVDWHSPAMRRWKRRTATGFLPPTPVARL